MFVWLFTLLFYFCLVLGLLVIISVLYFFTYEIFFQLGWLSVEYLPGLERKHVLITGCDSGFGFHLACCLDNMGCPVFAACLTEEGQRRVTEKCSSRLKALYVDVTEIETIKSAYDEISAILRKAEPKGELWGIVNNAGIINNLSWIELDNLESMKKISDVNLWGMVAVTKIFLPLLKKSKGRIVNVSSVAGRMSGPSAMSYTISKYGVEAFSDSLRLEMKSWDISVHILEPAGFTTRITDKELTISNVAQRWGDLDQPTKENYGEDFLHDVVMFWTSAELSSSLNMVTDSMTHALFSTKPRTRYYPGFLSGLFVSWMSLLPAEMSDFIFVNILIKLATGKSIPVPKAAELQKS